MNDHADKIPDYRTQGDTEPWLYRLPKVSHYYGDFIRQSFVGAAALLLLAAPFYGDYLPVELPFEILGAVVLVAAAAMTNPWSRTIIAANAVIAGVGMVIFELWALGGYGSAGLLQFALRQALAITFMFGFYFSMKTFRSMTLHQVGHPDNEPVDIDPEKILDREPDSDDEEEALREQRKKWHKQAIHERREYDG